jgi:hypothetical protein
MNPIIDELIRILQKHSAVKRVRVVNYDETPTGKLEVKIRCRLVRDYRMQVWLHHETGFQDYAYQLFTDHPILRWDNAPHYPHISTAPHHFHDENNKVSESPLKGKMQQDLKTVLSEIGKWLRSENGSEM